MENLGLTHKDLAKALGVSETTIKSYRRKFPACIMVASKGKPLRFTPEAEVVCRRIQAFFAVGMAVEDVRLRLAEEFSWIEAEINETHEDADLSGGAEQNKDEHKKALLNEAARLKEALQGQQGKESTQRGNIVTQTASPVEVVAPQNAKIAMQSAKVTPQESPKEISHNEGQTRTTPYAALPPELRTTISDMARTVIELTLQQKKLMKHIENLEKRFEERFAHVVEHGLVHELPEEADGLQSVCPQKPIHEQIKMASQNVKKQEEQEGLADMPEQDINHTADEAACAPSPEDPSATEQKQSRANPLLKIFGLERHG